MVTPLALQGAAVAFFAAVIAFFAGYLAHTMEPWKVAGIVGVTGLVAVVTGVFAFRRTGEAIVEVEGAATRLAHGELTTRITADGSAASVLTRTFNMMAGQLQQVFDAQTAEHARLAAVFDAVADSIIALAADTSVRFLNPAAETQLQATASLAIGRRFIESVRDFELDGLARETIASGVPHTRIITYGQKRVPLRASVLPIVGGGEWSVLVMLTDLSEERRLDTMRREFVANVSHELRTPLASIRALAESIESGYVDAEDLPEFTRRIQMQVERLTSLVNELLDLSRIESGAMTLAAERVVLADAVREALGTLQPRLEAAEVRSDVRGDNSVAVEADHASLVRVLSNLLDNAVKFSPPGAAIWVEISDHGDAASVSIRDEGPGIAPEDKPRVFERFYTGDRSRAGVGVGLGLAIVKHLVRAHNGSVEVESLLGSGATFTLRLSKRFSGLRSTERLR